MAAREICFEGLKQLSGLAVGKVLVQAGDTIGVDQGLVLVESEALSFEIVSHLSGVVSSVHARQGDPVVDGGLIVVIDSVTAAEATTIAADTNAGAPDKMVAATPTHLRAEAPLNGVPHATPSQRKKARELGVAVQAPSAASPPAAHPLTLLPWPKVDFSRFGPVERKPRSRIQKISAANLHRNWVAVPHVTNHDDADITELEAFRQQVNQEQDKGGTKITMLAFLIKAAVAALRQYPAFNASLDGDELVLKQYFNIGFAADTPNGLVVPVIADADKKGIAELAREAAELAAKAREGKLTPAEMTGGCFSISSLGGIGGTYFTPIINAPEVAILGVCKSAWRPTWDGQGFVPRLTLPLSLSWDHRVIDGAAAARFVGFMARTLSDFRRVSL